MFKNPILRNLYIWYRERYFWHLKKKSIREIFTNVYKNNEWGGEPGKFYSGEGTHDPNVELYIRELTDFIRKNNITSLLDIGCGDFRVMSGVLEQVNVDYTGVDVVEEMIQHHQKKYSNATTRFILLDAIDDALPDAALVTVRQVLQHLSNEQIKKILHKISGYKYALITEHILTTDAVVPNLDKIPGPHIRTRVFSSVFIDQPPFDIKHARILFEYEAKEKIKSKLYPAVIRTYLIDNSK